MLKGLYDIGWSDEQKCRAVTKKKPSWREVRNQIPEGLAILAQAISVLSLCCLRARRVLICDLCPCKASHNATQVLAAVGCPIRLGAGGPWTEAVSWTNNRRNVMRKLVVEEGWVQERQYDIGRSDEKNCRFCARRNRCRFSFLGGHVCVGPCVLKNALLL